MKIHSTDMSSWVNIDANKHGHDYSCTLEASIELGHGHFSGKNTSIHFLNYEKFINEYDRFMLDRDITPTLNGTYDTYLRFISKRNNVIFLEFCIDDAFSGYSETANYSIRGEFEIDSEYLNRIHNDFKRLAADN